MSAFAIVLGVAFVAGSFVFTDLLGGAFDGIVKGTTADVEVSPQRVIDVQSLGTAARTLPASLMHRLRALPDAAQVAGTAEVQGVFVIGADGKLVGGNGPPGLAFNYTGMTAITGVRIPRSPRGDSPWVSTRSPSTKPRRGRPGTPQATSSRWRPRVTHPFARRG